jgi:hypothetical protein
LFRIILGPFTITLGEAEDALYCLLFAVKLADAEGRVNPSMFVSMDFME